MLLRFFDFQILATLQSAVFPSTLFDLYAFKVKELPSFMDSYTTTSLSDPTLSSMSSTTKSFPTNVNQTNNTSVPLTIENIQKRPNTAACNGHGIFQNGNRSLSSRSLYGLSHSLNYCSKDLDTESIFAKPSPRDKPECRFTQLTVELYDPNKEWEYFITLSSQPNCMKVKLNYKHFNLHLMKIILIYLFIYLFFSCEYRMRIQTLLYVLHIHDSLLFQKLSQIKCYSR